MEDALLKKLMMAGLAAGALALNAPAAVADAPTFDCNFNSLHQEDATGQNYEGVAWGYVHHAGGGPVSIRCYITVNGTPASSTPTGTGDTAATTAGRVTFAAGETDNVLLWAEVTTVHGTINQPYPTSTTQIPPQEVIDLLIDIATLIDEQLAPVWDEINNLVIQHIDPALCDLLKMFPGTYGTPPGPVITINAQGDVFIDGEPFWDCPPYDLFPPAA